MRATVAMNTDATAPSPFDPPTLRAALRAANARLFEAGVDSPGLTAEVLLRHVLGTEQSEFYLRLGDPLSLRDYEKFQKLLDRRAAGEPVAYLIGHKEFWSLDFIVTPAVLIPRPETELLVELALDYARAAHGGETMRILDIGTGSGAIAVALAMQLPEAEVWAVDISPAALRVARSNGARHGVGERVHWLAGDLFEALNEAGARFDLIVSNPPYVRSAEMAGLAREIRQWEPRRALDGGDDGLDYYRRIIGAAPRHLHHGGQILLETGSDMAQAVVDLLARAGCYGRAAVRRDYAGLERAVTAARGSRHG